MPSRARLLSRSTALLLLAATSGCPDGTAGVTDGPDTTTGTATEPTTGAPTTGTPTTGTTSTTTSGPTSAGASTTDDTSAVTTTRGETTGEATASTTGETTDDTTTTGTTTTGTTTTGTTSTTSTTDTTTGDTTTGDDPVVALSGYDWLHYITGYSSLEPLLAEKLPNGHVFVTGGGGLYGRYVTLATGEPEEITYNLDGIGAFAEWLDEADGSRVHSRMLTTTKSPMGTYGFSNAITHAPEGDIVVAGYWWGENYFNLATPYQSVMKSESLIINNQYHRAEDPFFTRMDGAGAVEWLHRGRTPGPLNTSWFNQPRGIVALPDGDFLTTADYERPGFIAFYGTAGAKTMSGTNSAYMARLGANGVPKWILECAGNFVRGRGLAAGPGGAVYTLTYENMVLFKGTPDELTIPKEADDDDTKWMYPLVRIDPAGKSTWVRRIVGIGGSFTPALVVRDDDSAVIVAELNGELQIRDGQDIAGSLATKQADVVIARFTPDGGLAWIRALGLKSGRVLTAEGDEVWIAGTLPGTATSVKLGDQEVPLPALQFDTKLDIRVLLRISADGVATEVRVVGAGLPSEYLSSDGLSLLLTGTYHCDMAVPVLFDEGGVGVPMASACAQPDTKAYRGYVLSVKI